MKKIIWFALIITVVLLACKVTISPSSPSVDNEVDLLRGRQAIVFGDSLFTSNAREDLESYGMIVTTSSDLKSALPLAGSGFVEFHCLNSAGNTTIIHASKPDNILLNGEDTITECDKGIIFRFRTADNPDIVIP